MENLKEELKYGEKGITLISLVVTIIILIILAGVSISLVLGENGIVTKAKDAKQNMQVAANEEQQGLANLEVALQEGLNSGSGETGGNTETKLTFTIDSESYQFEEGMTWAQWVASAYNTANYRIDGFKTGKGVVVRSDSTDSVKYVPVVSNKKALASDIISSGNYSISTANLPNYWYLSSEGDYTSASSEDDLVTALSNNAQIVHCPDGTYNTSAEYEASHPSPTLITFTIDGTSYQAEEGMTWGEWVNSKYNDGQFEIDDYKVVNKSREYAPYVCKKEELEAIAVSCDDVIVSIAYGYTVSGGGSN